MHIFKNKFGFQITQGAQSFVTCCESSAGAFWFLVITRSEQGKRVTHLCLHCVACSGGTGEGPQPPALPQRSPCSATVFAAHPGGRPVVLRCGRHLVHLQKGEALAPHSAQQSVLLEPSIRNRKWQIHKKDKKTEPSVPLLGRQGEGCQRIRCGSQETLDTDRGCLWEQNTPQSSQGAFKEQGGPEDRCAWRQGSGTRALASHSHDTRLRSPPGRGA